MIIIYPTDAGVAQMHPCDCGLTIEQIAIKDTPAGVPFLIINDADVDKYHDFTQPHGVGMGPVDWFIHQIDSEINRVKKMDLAAIVINEIIQDLEAQKRNLS